MPNLNITLTPVVNGIGGYQFKVKASDVKLVKQAKDEIIKYLVIVGYDVDIKTGWHEQNENYSPK
jgi:hypothetical protein